MPGLDGWSVLQALKADPELAEIPVVMLTIVDEKNKGYALGASEYVTKPIDRERLRALLARFCEPGAEKRALVVEDDEDTRRWLHHALEREGWQVSQARTAGRRWSVSARRGGRDPARSHDAGDGRFRVSRRAQEESALFRFP